ncbi:BMP family lipoprotein [Enterococcus sp. AZ109]|uniref:BMP family lipoprotein n=1 Tax=Enterococcus sp. AZ109 TaxID=2774634 RepID=UPI003F26EDE7
MKFLRLGFLLGILTMLASCGQNDAQTAESDKSPKIALILGFGGVDDRSFNQAGWEGLETWGKEKKLKEQENYIYIETNDPKDNSTNVTQAIDNDYNTIISLSYLQADAIKEAAVANPDLDFALVDGEIEDQDNVVSATFKDQESAYLAGIAAAYTTKTGRVGFIGGMEGPVIQRFEVGFEEGVKDGAKVLGKKVTVDSRYANSYDAPDLGKANASSMYEEGADIIYQAAGSTGSGVFQEARARNEQAGNEKVWVIGVDRDQENEGEYETSEGEMDNFTLTSTIKNVGAAVSEIAEAKYNQEFPGGDHLVFGIKEDGVDLTQGQLSENALKAVNEAKQKIIEGTLVVPEK